jgi:hypothetical protein
MGLRKNSTKSLSEFWDKEQRKAQHASGNILPGDLTCSTLRGSSFAKFLHAPIFLCALVCAAEIVRWVLAEDYFRQLSEISCLILELGELLGINQDILNKGELSICCAWHSGCSFV